MATMESTQLPTAADLEARAARIADPTNSLKSRYDNAVSLREMVDSVRDAEATRVFPQMAGVLLDILRNNEPCFKKDTQEYQFRRVLVEIVNRIPLLDTLRPTSGTLMSTLLHILRTDNEENVATCMKTTIDIIRNQKPVPEENIMEVVKFIQELLGNMAGLVEEYLSDHSKPVEQNTVFPGIRSFKVLAEVPFALVIIMQMTRSMTFPPLNDVLNVAMDTALLESPLQKRERENSEAMGGIWVGLSPSIVNQQVYNDFITGQIKLATFIASLMKSQQDVFRQDGRGDLFAKNSVRLLQDCPVQLQVTRKELLYIMRHLTGTPHRRAFLPEFEKLMSDRVLFGGSVGNQELLRPIAYTVLAEVVNHLRDELTMGQLSLVVFTYAGLVLNHKLPLTIQLLGVRLLYNMVDPALKKEDPEAASKLIHYLIQTSTDKITALAETAEDVFAKAEAQKQGVSGPDAAYIEKDRPIAGTTFTSDNPEDIMKEIRFIYRTILHGCRTCIAALKKLNAQLPDGEIMLPFFRATITCMSFPDTRDAREEKELMESVAVLFGEINPHVLQEIWVSEMDFFYNAVIKRGSLLHILQTFYSQESTSTALVSIALRHFGNKLGELGEYDELHAAVTVRFFKLAFGAVTMFAEANEPILASHLGHLIMDSFPLASKATTPTHYFQLMRALFRAIGSGGGKYEHLYREVLPLLPEMLDSLNRQLMAAEGSTRELLVELCLTVPLRLTHLLPHLHYLMQPLVLALQGGPELVSQGLRTLELCIDNLIGDFLDPIIRPVLRDLMEALHSHLRPLPANHHHAHTTIRILGKLGGRNRRLLDETPHLDYTHYSDLATLSLAFSGRPEKIQAGPVALLAAKLLQRPQFGDKVHAYNYLEHTLTVLLNEGLQGHDREEIFVKGVEGLFDAIHIPDIQERAEAYLRTLSHHIFTLECRRALVKTSKDIAVRRYPSHLFGLYLDALPHALARTDSAQRTKATEIVKSIIHGIVPIADEMNLQHMDLMFPLHQVSGCFTALCFQEAWIRKEAGCTGIMIIATTPEVGEKWTSVRDIDLVRTLLHLLKDLPHDPPRNVSNILDILMHILRIAIKPSPPLDPSMPTPTNKIPYLISIFFSELSSAHPVVRKAVRSCIELISELTEKSIYDLLRPHRERALTALFTKPLRALPHPIIIGQIEAIRYCLCLNPPLPDLTEELLRLLHETLALADLEDAQLVARNNVRQSTIEATNLRVACIKLLTASMPLTDFFAKQSQTRTRVIAVYFKSLYSSSPEVKDVAHEGLRCVLEHQHRLPKDIMQSGLRPILMNLADPKRLSVAGLEGLARLLKLLTNYFKVEIGSKLLDHFRVIADPQVLAANPRMPITDNEAVAKLVRLVNIFHLLPSAANVYLAELVNVVVQTEVQLQSALPSPFSEPLGKFLDRYPTESVDFFLANITSKRHVRTLRNVLLSKKAPLLHREFIARPGDIANACFRTGNDDTVLPGLRICSDLLDLTPGWTVTCQSVISALVAILRSGGAQTHGDATEAGIYAQKHKLVVSFFTRTLEESPRVDLLFELVAVYSRPLSLEMSGLTRFLYSHVALKGSLTFRRNVMARFLTWFDDHAVDWQTKTYFIRYVITPMLLVHSNRLAVETILDKHIIHHFHEKIWARMGNKDDRTFADADDVFRIEILYLTIIMVQHFSHLLSEAKKDIFRCAWAFISSEDTIVKQSAYLLAARLQEVFESPIAFLMSSWTGLLKPPHPENRALVRQALDILAGVLQKRTSDTGIPPWAQSTRRFLADEAPGNSQVNLIYQLIVRQPDLFYPCRSIFVSQMVNSLAKLGLHGNSSLESRLLSLEIISVIFNWEQRSTGGSDNRTTWATPHGFRETMVSYLVRLAISMPEVARTVIVPKALKLLGELLGSSGWSDVSFKWDFFRKALDQNEITPQTLTHAIASAKVLSVVCANRPDTWYAQNATVLQSLIQKGMQTEDRALLESLHPIFERLVRLFPLPKEDEDAQEDEMTDFHKFIYRAISDGLTEKGHRGALLMLKSVLDVTPERIEPFSASLLRVLGRLAKEHTQSQPGTSDYDGLITLLVSVFEICQDNPFLPPEQRKHLTSSLNILVEKSNSPKLCEFLLETARDWALKRKDAYPTMKEKVQLLSKMIAFETRGEGLFNRYLELIYDIYTEPSLKRSDLTTKLEISFLIGCRARDTSLRERFIDLLDSSVPRSLTARLTYIFGIQSWEALADHNWIHLALDLVLSSIDGDEPLVPTPSSSFKQSGSPLAQTTINTKAKDITRPMRRLFFYNPQAAHETWISVFSSIWSSLSRKEQSDVSHHLIVLLSREYHLRQAELRPNIIQTLLEGIHACNPPLSLPPHLIKYLAKIFGAWHVGMEHLQSCLDVSREEDSTTREMIYDSLAELYADLAEDDMFYGLWRRRCLHLETNVAVSYEQNGMWQEAQIAYENAQLRAKNGIIPFSEPEYCLWEDHWILATEKLQQWDVLCDLARADGSHDLFLESAWRNKDWSDKEARDTIEEQLQQMSDVATPRRRVYEAFLALVKTPVAMDRNADFTRILEDAMQLALRKWVGLPARMSAAHIPLLQNFQQLVELQEATQVFNSLATTTPQNLERKSSDLKMVLQAWRERLPNLHDDISVWSDLVAWRQNVFNAINKHYIPLIQSTQGNQPANSANSTFGYRGYHETAWIINRFAHVARKHDLLEVAQASLTKIYELPNIEISEAFLKLREEARCRLQVPDKLNDGLNLILNTNLMYFSTPQKAEFYSLKGMFYSALGQNEEADQYFGQAVQLDMQLPKAWAEWGRYNDKVFSERPNDFSAGASAVSCYLQAAGLYKNTKSRPLLTRVLWLLSVDDNAATIAQAFDTYTGDSALWYWITLIPQLCSSLSHREAKQARSILLAIAKQFPQALFFTLRTTKEDLNFSKKQAMDMLKARNAQGVNGTVGSAGEASGLSAVNGTKMEDVTMTNSTNGARQGPSSSPTSNLRPDYEYVDELASILKTAYPLLALSLETMVDQFCTKFKASPEEEVYRFTLILLQDAIQAYTARVTMINDDGSRPEAIIRSVARLAPHFAGQAKKDYEEDFLKDNPTLQQHIRRLQSWRDRYESFLDSRPRVQPLDLLSPWLVEFQYSKVDEIEVPGQYLEHLDSNQQFTRVRKFGSKFNLCRGQGYCYKRFVIHGHDGTQRTFAVQQPAARWCRREDCVMQLFRTFNHALTRRKESRKRNLHFHFPLAVSLGTSVRLLSNDPSYVSLQDIYDRHCDELGITREDPILMAGEKIRAVLRESQNIPNKTEFINLKKTVIDELVTKMIPDDILTNYMTRTMNGPMELWRMRKAFTLQLSAVSFMTYIICITSRQPSRFHISRTTGQIYMSEILPGTSTISHVFSSNESVPFRLTPNIQHFVTPVGTEALLVPGIVAIARALTKPEYDLDQHLCLFSRDEVRAWKSPVNADKPFKEKVTENINSVVQKAEVMSCKYERGQEPRDADKPVPAMQTVMNLVSMATNPLKLAMMHDWSSPWF